MEEERSAGVWLAGARVPPVGTPPSTETPPSTGPLRPIAAGDAPFRDLLLAWLQGGAPARHVRLVARTGDARTDALVDDLAPGLVALLERLTDRQREVARLLLVDGIRRAQIAEALGISRPTVSVMVDRARIVELGPLAAALDDLFAAGVRMAPAGDHPAAALDPT